MQEIQEAEVTKKGKEELRTWVPKMMDGGYLRKNKLVPDGKRTNCRHWV